MHAIYASRRHLIPFRATLLPQLFTDVLVVGAGVAGASAALAVVAADPQADVIVVTKAKVEDSNTAYAQGGIASVLDAEDSIGDHVQDTLVAGADLCDEAMVRKVVEEGPVRLAELIRAGMPLDRDGAGQLKLGLEGGHGRARIVHSEGDATGRALAMTLKKQMQAQKGRIRLFEDCFALDFITDEGGAVRGLLTQHPRFGLQVIWASSVILAGGGCGQVYRESTNPPVATGDAIAMGWRAGAELGDLAFVQFHPTTLYIAGASRQLITEAVRGEGAHLVDKRGHRFMPDYDPRAELAPRDIVSRSILAQMVKTDSTHAYLDIAPIGAEKFRKRFPGVAAMLEKYGIDLEKGRIPVHPSCHYMIGGLVTDLAGRTSLPGLLACGEAACSGLHGANRLASNSLLEGLVMGHACGLAAVEEWRKTGSPRSFKIAAEVPPSDRSELDLADVRSSLRSVMWRHVSIERDGPRLEEVCEMFDFWGRYTMDKVFETREGWEVQNLLTVGALITRSALWRKESRGTHSRTDFPEAREEYRAHDLWQKNRGQALARRVLAAD
jgi:L-aspartate oxidase